MKKNTAKRKLWWFAVLAYVLLFTGLGLKWGNVDIQFANTLLWISAAAFLGNAIFGIFKRPKPEPKKPYYPFKAGGLKYSADYAKADKVIESVYKREQIPAALKYLELFYAKYGYNKKGPNFWDFANPNFRFVNDVLENQCKKNNHE